MQQSSTRETTSRSTILARLTHDGHNDKRAFRCMMLALMLCRDDISGDNCLEYLTMCLKESMRMYPPVSVIARRLTKETVFDGRKMPAGE